MDDDFIFWSLQLNFGNFEICLNNMDPSIKFTLEKPEISYEGERKERTSFKFFDVKIIWNEENTVETDIHYKPTNIYDYSSRDSAQPDHTKNNPLEPS